MHYIYDLRNGKFTRDQRKLLGIDRRFNESRICACLDIGMRALHRRRETFHRDRIGTRDNLEVAVHARVHRGTDLLNHLVERHDILAGEVTTLLRKHLVLDLQTCRTSPLDHAHSPRNVDRIAEAGVPVDEDRHRHRIDDRPDVVGKLAQGDQAYIRYAKVHVGNAGTGDIDAVVAQILGHARKQRIWRAGNDGRVALGENRLQSLGTCAHGALPPGRPHAGDLRLTLLTDLAMTMSTVNRLAPCACHVEGSSSHCASMAARLAISASLAAFSFA